MDAVIEQLEKLVELIRENPDKGVGLKITSIIDTLTPADESAPALPSVASVNSNGALGMSNTTMEVHRHPAQDVSLHKKL